MVPICDIHCHILPGVDDGCKDLAETLKVLQIAREQGVYDLIATPHFYNHREDILSFLRRRNDAYESLKPCLPEDMRICLGAEVAYFSGIGSCQELHQLCLGNSRFLLLELPFTPWNSNMIRELQNLTYSQGITPVLAHIERYMPIQSKQAMQQVLELDVAVQMNAEKLLRLRTSFRARRFVKNGTVQLLGSDCHSSTVRSFNLGMAVEHLEKHGMHRQLQTLAEFSQEVFDRAYGDGSTPIL